RGREEPAAAQAGDPHVRLVEQAPRRCEPCLGDLVAPQADVLDAVSGAAFDGLAGAPRPDGRLVEAEQSQLVGGALVCAPASDARVCTPVVHAHARTPASVRNAFIRSTARSG